MAFLHSDHQVAIKPQQQQGFFKKGGFVGGLPILNYKQQITTYHTYT